MSFSPLAVRDRIAMAVSSVVARGGRLVLAALAALLLVAVVLPGVALGITTRDQVSSFNGSDSDAGAIADLGRVAVHQGSGSVYAIDAARGVVDRFDASGAAQDFSALGTSSLDGSAVPPPDGPTSLSLAAEGDLAVDNSGTASDGNLIVVAELQQTVWVFDSTGAYLHRITGFGDPCGVAVDSEGHVWVSDYNAAAVIEYDAAGVATGSSIDTSGVGNPCHIAFDADDNLYVALWNGAVHKYDPAGAYVGAVDFDPTLAVTVDQSNGRVYVVHSDRVSVYDGAATKLYDFANAIAGASLIGIAINEAADEAYVADTAADTVRVFGPPFLAPPAITVPGASGVTATEATIAAKVNPRGEQTTYHFEYGTTSSYGTTLPIPDASAGAGTDPVSASRFLNGLEPNTTYHWRIVATNANGTVESPDKTFTTPPTPTTTTDCPNQLYRTGPAANLPDCRAYEMVSPVDKNNGDINTIRSGLALRTGLEQSSVDGSKLTYSSYKAFGDAVSAPWTSQYIATRGPAGWSSHSINPPRDTTIFNSADLAWDYDVQFKAFTDDLSKTWVFNNNAVPLTPDAVEGRVNLYMRDNVSDSYRALTSVESPLPLDNMYFQGHSADGSHALFADQSPRTPDAPLANTWQVYDYSGGELHLVSIMPDGSASTENSSVGALDTSSIAGPDNGSTRDHAVSDDGSRIFWSTHSNSDNKGAGDLYVRIDGERTVPIATTGDVFFRAASADGSKVIFDTALGGGYGDLYEFDVDAGTRRLVAANVRGVLGASDDLSYIYFVSTDDLAAGAAETENNLYVEHDGVVEFIATLAPRDVGLDQLDHNNAQNVAGRVPFYRPARVTPDGRHIAFESVRSLTGYDNTDAVNGEADIEVFVYGVDEGRVVCASCNPSGASPRGQALRFPYTAVDEVRVPAQGAATAAAWLTTAASSHHIPRALSVDGGRLFFNSFDALVAGDTNGQQDVYQWEAQGSGGCQKPDGCVDLISSGQSSDKSEFVDASADGRDVFFSTSSSLVGQDTGRIDIYDARVGGGFAPPAAGPADCDGEACQGPSTAPKEQLPASSVTGGLGNGVRSRGRAGIRVVGRTVGARAFSLRVRVSGKGVITGRGAGVKGVRRRVARAGTYKLTFRLTAKARRRIAKGNQAKLRVQVRFTAGSGGKASQDTAVLRLEQSKKADKARAAKNDRGGAK
ncbi:MAG TPA: NHL repeat-containing protein [Thermoleophilaceae bacterium]|nr:NHL repeat-containing protein [Thermoleophilaceae bacterium]